MQGLSLFCGAGTIALAYLFLVRFDYASRKLALLACLFCATSTPFLYFSTLTLSETSFAVTVQPPFVDEVIFSEKDKKIPWRG
jgi:hypothetical protein